ncbi:MAG: PocR ligand-binding domain-containing protein [Bacillota bacterium]|nr:PocR ligand-binding domain-containing protein [Bacillota bacterium]
MTRPEGGEKFEELVDLAALQRLQDDFSAACGLATSILDPEGRVLTRSGWSEVCAEFHARSPQAAARCRASDRRTVMAAAEEGGLVIGVCDNGLVTAATPILVGGRHLASLSLSQVLFEPPDEDYFRAQARELGLEEEPYLAAVRRIRVMPKDDFLRAARYFTNMAGLISNLSQWNWEQKMLDEELKRERARFEAIFQGSGDAMRIIGTDFRIQDQNRCMSELSGVSDDQAVGQKCFASFHHPFCGREECILHRILSGEERLKVETQMSRPDGKTVFVELIATPLRDETGKITGIIESFRDIGARKRIEERLRYLTMHDPLTGLYNRAYFEEEMRRVDIARQGPVSIIVADVDGLKIINDTLGHYRGDEFLKAAAGAIRRIFRAGDCVARIGGDEFAAILHHTDHDAAERACRRIRATVMTYNNAGDTVVPLSLSIGLATTGDPSMNPSDLFKEADNNMYREKLLSSASVRNATVQALMAALEARDFITEGHADRLQHLAGALGRAIGLAESGLANVRLLARFHDIGKVGIPDRILFKPGPLTPEERREMQRHSEIGHRIALSSPVLAPIADLILKHHEWWDGNGYPLRQKGKEIPLECRILAIVDAYDAMTSDRPYREAMPREEAFRELLRCAGTQFDPYLLQKFITTMR